MTLGDRIKELALDNSMNLKEFFEYIDVSKPTMRNYISGTSTPNGTFLRDIRTKIGVSPTWLLLGEGPKYITTSDQNWSKPDRKTQFIPIPRFDVAASAGNGSISESELGTGHYAFNLSWLERRGLTANHLAVIEVNGDSMEPELYNGDLILLDRAQDEPKDGHIFVVRYSDELFVKRVQTMPDHCVSLRSTNKFYKDIDVNLQKNHDLTFIGRVVASMHEW